jgi:integrase
LYAFRAFIKFKIEDIYLRKKLINNLVKVTQAEPNITTKYLSNSKREDVIRNMTDDRYVLVAKIQNETGARARDILSLKKGSISFEKYQGLLALKLDIIGKGKKKNPKYIFDKELQQDILNFIKDKDIDKEYYFIDRSKCYDKNFDNMEIVFLTNYNWYWQELKKACIKSGIDPKQWGSHDYRRCIAREVYIATDKDVEQLKNFLGHARIETTLRYLKHSGLSTIDTSLLLARKNNRV